MRRGRCPPPFCFLSFYEWDQAISTNDVDLARASDNRVAVGAVHSAVAALCCGGSGWRGCACVTTVCPDGNHLALENGAIHFNLPEFVHVVEDELQDRVAGNGTRPTVFIGTGDDQAVFFGCALELLVMIHSIVGGVGNIMDDIQQVTRFMNHACNHFFQWPGGEVRR